MELFTNNTLPPVSSFLQDTKKSRSKAIKIRFLFIIIGASKSNGSSITVPIVQHLILLLRSAPCFIVDSPLGVGGLLAIVDFPVHGPDSSSGGVGALSVIADTHLTSCLMLLNTDMPRRGYLFVENRVLLRSMPRSGLPLHNPGIIYLG